jgi:transmembrane sensor
MQEKNSPRKLIKKYIDGSCNEQERALVESWHLHDLQQSDVKVSPEHIESAYQRGRLQAIAHIQSPQPIRKLWPRFAVAATILVLLIAGAFFIFKPVKSSSSLDYAKDIAPGGNQATLTLSNGKQIDLSNAHDGQLASQGNISVSKTADGNLSYLVSHAPQKSDTQPAYNILNTPVGGQYHLTLGDGTNVWLNAASSIKFPAAFTGSERKVEITGEVYFEVAHDAAKPFRVLSNKQVVEVLGTHFNLNTYADEESTKTTLLEGSVKVSNQNSSIVIKPGQQSVSQNGHLSVIEAANLDETIAWKNGYFQFKDEKIESVMRKLSRWYNIELQYQGTIPNEGFNGIISRSKNISQVLKMLEKTKAVHFKIEGRRVTVIQ